MMETMNCPCGKHLTYDFCCKPLHTGLEKAKTPEALMRSRYTAYVKHLVDYLFDTTHPATRFLYPKADLSNWARSNTWEKLEILTAAENEVEFKAYFSNNNRPQVHYERSLFKKYKNCWYYYSGTGYT